MWWRLWFVPIGLAMGLQANQPDDLRTNLGNARQRWAAHKPASYEFTIEVRCFCVGIAKTPPTFRVKADKSTAVTELPGQSDRLYDHYNTVEKLFIAIDRSLTRGRDKSTVTYNEDLGFPEKADLDPLRNVFDDELYLRVTNFRVIEK